MSPEEAVETRAIGPDGAKFQRDGLELESLERELPKMEQAQNRARSGHRLKEQGDLPISVRSWPTCWRQLDELEERWLELSELAP